MIIKGFIKNTKLLEETPKVPDSMEWDNIKNLIERKIKSIKKSSIIAIVGPYGIGKSTMLDKIEQDFKNTKNFWFNFEAWKYPERENLWENFIYDLTKASGVIKENEVRDLINGELHGCKLHIKNFLTTLSAMAHVDYIGVLFSSYIKDYPVKRICEFQKLLDKIIKKIDKPIYITIEDIDRSGDKGLFFLETLKNYLETKTSSKKIIILVPISSSHYEEDIDRYLKVIDHFEFFNPSFINFLRFVDNYLRDDLKTTNDHLLLADFFARYFSSYPDITIRKLKLILRQANRTYKQQLQDGKNADWRITMMAEFMKFTTFGKDNPDTYYKSTIRNNEIVLGTVFSAYIAAIYRKDQRLWNENTFIDSDYDIRLLQKNNNDYKDGIVPSLWLGQGDSYNSARIYLEDFYFRYN